MMKKIIMSLVVLTAVCKVFAEGVLCLTFDDRHFTNWCQAIKLFEKYDARATFFVNGKIDKSALSGMKQLQNAGHSIGLHSFSHAKAVDFYRKFGEAEYLKREIFPQLEVCKQNNIEIRSFAYPSSQRNQETDKILFKYFDFLRFNTGRILPKGGVLADTDGFFCKELGEKYLFPGYSLGGDFDMKAVKQAMERAANEDAIIVFYAHNITPEIAKSHHISLGQLEEILSFAVDLKLQIKGLNEL